MSPLTKSLLKSLLFTLVLPLPIYGLIPYLFITAGPRVLIFKLGLLRMVGLPMIVAGAAMYGWCVWNFAAVGQGTPAPIAAPRHLVIAGLYRYVRNPMYLGGVIILLGEAILFGSVAVALHGFAFWLTVHLFATLYEEPHLRQLFGADYEAYLRTVPRWLPRFRGYTQTKADN